MQDLASDPELGGFRVALRAIAAWYERIFTDATYLCPPAPHDLKVFDLLVGTARWSECPERIIAERAIRVAEELIRYRHLLEGFRCFLETDAGSGVQVETSTTRTGIHELCI